MVDSISNATNAREIGALQSRAQASPAAPAPAAPPAAQPALPDQHVEALQAAVEKLIKKSLPTNSKLQIVQDQATGTFIYRSIDPNTGQVISQYPAEQVIRLREYLRDMEGVLVDKTV